jgi:predicted nuclease of predicted toxin-antitoxin system
MKVLLDMNLSPRWSAALATAHIDAVHWSIVGRSDSLDTEIIAFAEHNGYVIITQDLDFGNLLASSNSRKPSVVQLRTEELDPDVIGAQVIRLLQQLEAELKEGALITFNPRRTRVRILPLR